MAVVHAELGEEAMARVAVQQFNDRVERMVPRFQSLLRSAPRNRVEPAERFWAGVSQHVLPSSLAAQRVLSASAVSFELDVKTETE